MAVSRMIGNRESSTRKKRRPTIHSSYQKHCNFVVFSSLMIQTVFHIKLVQQQNHILFDNFLFLIRNSIWVLKIFRNLHGSSLLLLKLLLLSLLALPLLFGQNLAQPLPLLKFVAEAHFVLQEVSEFFLEVFEKGSGISLLGIDVE